MAVDDRRHCERQCHVDQVGFILDQRYRAVVKQFPIRVAIGVVLKRPKADISVVNILTYDDIPAL